MSEAEGAAGSGRYADAAALRREFDAGFAAPLSGAAEASEDLLAVRIGPDPFTLRLAEIAGLHADLTIVPLPSSSRSLIGLAGIRGGIRPIHDLAALLGYPASDAVRWVIFPKAAPHLGLAFAALESHLRVARESLLYEENAAAHPAAAPVYTRGLARVGATPRPIIHLESLATRVMKDEAT